jgi:hypothetical protein
MDAGPWLQEVTRALRAHALEAVLIGNGAAALQGAPVTTLDLDFMFHDSTTNVARLKLVARTLEATVFRPYYPVSRLFRVQNDERALQLDFMPTIHGVRSFPSLKSRAHSIQVGPGLPLLVADLADIIRSKRATGRPKDHAVLPVLEATHALQTKAAEEAPPVRPPEGTRRPARRRGRRTP